MLFDINCHAKGEDLIHFYTHNSRLSVSAASAEEMKEASTELAIKDELTSGLAGSRWACTAF